jgi:polar amino acid transport system permease protein
VLTVMFIPLAVPFAGVTLSAFASVLVSLTIMQIVYFSEVFRGALAAVGKGQFDAAYACGLRTSVVFRKVILPQAALVSAPAFASSLVLLVQNTSIGSAVALNDLIGSALTIQNMTGAPSPLVAAAIGYLIIIVPMVRLARRWEQRMAKAI